MSIGTRTTISGDKRHNLPVQLRQAA